MYEYMRKTKKLANSWSIRDSVGKTVLFTYTLGESIFPISTISLLLSSLPIDSLRQQLPRPAKIVVTAETPTATRRYRVHLRSESRGNSSRCSGVQRCWRNIIQMDVTMTTSFTRIAFSDYPCTLCNRVGSATRMPSELKTLPFPAISFRIT